MTKSSPPEVFPLPLKWKKIVLHIQGRSLHFDRVVTLENVYPIALKIYTYAPQNMKMVPMPYAKSGNPDQSVHVHSLIRFIEARLENG